MHSREFLPNTYPLTGTASVRVSAEICREGRGLTGAENGRSVNPETPLILAVLGGLDGLVFTAGIGERSAVIRERICEASAWLGIELDRDANARNLTRISTPGSRTSAWVIPTNEELIIARHAGSLLHLRPETALRPACNEPQQRKLRGLTWAAGGGSR